MFVMEGRGDLSMRKGKCFLTGMVIYVFIFLAGCGIEDKTASLESNGVVDSDGFPVVAVDSGVYFFGNYVYYFDEKTETATLLCNKPDCEHLSVSDGTCNAFFHAAGDTYIYEGNIYVPVSEDEGYVLYRVRPDGSGFDPFLTLVQTNEEIISSIGSCGVDGYYYFALTAPVTNEEQLKEDEVFDIYRVEMKENAQPELLCSTSMKRGGYLYLEPSVNGVWVYVYYDDESRIYFLEEGSQTLQQLFADQIFLEFFTETACYYGTKEGEFYKYEDGEKRVVIEKEEKLENSTSELVYDGKIYISTKEAIEIYTEDGEFINTLSYGTVGAEWDLNDPEHHFQRYLVGVTDGGLYLFYNEWWEGGDQCIYYMPLEEALSGNGEAWQEALSGFMYP